jgi:hypothetical protein
MMSQNTYDKRIWEKPNWVIFLDLDGVIADWETQRKNWGWNAQSNTDYFPHKFWANIPIFDHGLAFYRALRDMAPVVILTSPSNNPECLSGKAEWIDKHLKTRDFLIGGCKWAAAGPKKILIDDSEKKLIRFAAAGGVAIHCIPSKYGDVLNQVKNLVNHE